MSELTIRTAIVNRLRREGAYVLVTTGVATAGTPDLLVCYHGLYTALEVKAPKGYPSKLQTATLERISRAGGVAKVVRSVRDAEAVMGWV